MSRSVRNLNIIFGDQLDAESPLLQGADPERDVCWMAEVPFESTQVWSHKQRIVLFLSAMRHFRDELVAKGFTVHYNELSAQGGPETFSAALEETLKALTPERIRVVEPGEWRVEQGLKKFCQKQKLDLEVIEDTHFYCSREEFFAHAEGRKSLRLETFYREWRKKTGVLMEGAEPVGGQWNYDHDNRSSFGSGGPGELPRRPESRPDPITQAVIELVQKRFADHPGEVTNFAWPVTRRSGLHALKSFIEERLPNFGKYQDAMWTDTPFAWHSLIASSLNLKLLNPREVVAAAEEAWRSGHAPIEAVEGFIRQILGWREYIRGVYWQFMPGYKEMNALEADQPLPDFFWTGQTEMNCLRHTIGQTLEHGYAHHIQRLMVTGLYALLLGVRPTEIHEWYLAVYVDAVEWVELPNVLGMSQFADGGKMATKPYCASGKYIQRMSNYCQGCKFNPAERTGDTACPFTTLYWDFLLRNEKRLKGNNRMAMQLRNLDRLDAATREEIQTAAARLKT
jgi:deoxyribodipyrimidine photolyase-related protein